MVNANTVTRLQVRVDSSDIPLLNQRLAATQAQASSLQQQFRSFGGSIRQFSRSMFVFASLPIAAAFGASTLAAGRFEEAMIEVQKVTDQFSASALSDEVREMAQTIPLAQTELAGLTAQAARFGIRGVENITSFVEAVAKISIATDLTADKAGESFARLATLTNTPAKEISNLGSAVNELSNNFATSTSEIVQSMLRAGAAASTFGLNVTQVAGLSAALNEVSESSERAGSRLRRLFQELTNPNKVSDFASALGLTVQQFRRMRETAPQELLIQLLETMREGGQGAGELRVALGEAARQGLEPLSQNLGNVIRALGLSADAFERNTSLTREFDDATSTFFSQLKLLRNQLVEIGLTLGNELMPMLRDFVGQLSDIADAFQSLTDETKALIVQIGLWTLAINGVIAVIGFLFRPITALIGFFSTLSTTVIPALVSAFKTLKVAIFVAATDGIAVMIAKLTALQTLGVVAGVAAIVAAFVGMGFAIKNVIEDTQQLRGEIDELLNMGIEGQSRSELRERIDEITASIDALREKRSDTTLGLLNPEDQQRLKDLNEALKLTKQRLEELQPVGVLRPFASGIDFDAVFGDIPDKPLILKFRPEIEGGGGPGPAGFSEDVQKILDDLQQSLNEADIKLEFPGLFPDFNNTRSRISAFNEALQDLALEGLDRSSKAFQRVKQQLDAFRETLQSVSEISPVSSFDAFGGVDRELISNIQDQIDQFRFLEDVLDGFDAQNSAVNLLERNIRQLTAAGGENSATMDELILLYNLWTGESIQGAKELKDELDSVGEASSQIEDTVRSLNITFESAFEDAIFEARRLSDVISALLEDIARAITQAFILRPLLEGGPGSGGGILGGIGNILGGLFGSDSSTTTSDGGSSGNVTNLGDGLVRSNGDVIKFDPNDNILAMKDFSKIGGGDVTVNVINNNGSQVETRQRQKAGGGLELDVLVENAVRSGFDKGRFDGTLSRNFNLKRNGF